ncbi:hypothetical protein NC652_003226 [Populus alba x Populus x berolinensis]|nr:hypothetical protein NC652_003226 [Populus alba x Populus x berolinensis]
MILCKWEHTTTQFFTSGSTPPIFAKWVLESTPHEKLKIANGSTPPIFASGS